MSLPVASVGGVFLATRNVGRLAAWYRELGIPLGDGGYCVLGPDGRAADGGRGLVFAIHEARGELPAAGGDLGEEPYGRQRVMLNLRVDDLELALEALHHRGVAFTGPRKDAMGAFAWCKDPDGNLVELWQPA